jgi:hypothetical protein
MQPSIRPALVERGTMPITCPVNGTRKTMPSTRSGPAVGHPFGSVVSQCMKNIINTSKDKKAVASEPYSDGELREHLKMM